MQVTTFAVKDIWIGYKHMSSAEQDNPVVPASKRRVGWQVALIVPAVFIIGGVIAMCWGTIRLNDAQMQAAWPTAEGTVNVSTIIAHSSRKSSSFEVNIDYSYKVAESTYTGKNAIEHFGKVEDAGKCVATYPQGAKVKVYVNPASPSLSLLSPSDTTVDGYLYLILGGIFFIVGLVQFIGSWCTLKKQLEPTA
jgi:Protein of unknown function (DUF3592)